MNDEHICCETVPFYIIAPYLSHEHETPEGSLLAEKKAKHIYCDIVPLIHRLLTSAMSMNPLKGVSSLRARTKTFTWLFFLLLLAATCKGRIFYLLVNLFCWSLYIKSVWKSCLRY